MGWIARALHSALVPGESESLLWVQLLQRGTDRGGQRGAYLSDLQGGSSEDHLLLSVGEVEGMSPARRLLAEEQEYARLEEEQERFGEPEKRWC